MISFRFSFQRQDRHNALLNHPFVAADRRQHYNMARSMAAISLNFIIVVTPWTLKEVVLSCTGAKVLNPPLRQTNCFASFPISFLSRASKLQKTQTHERSSPKVDGAENCFLSTKRAGFFRLLRLMPVTIVSAVGIFEVTSYLYKRKQKRFRSLCSFGNAFVVRAFLVLVKRCKVKESASNDGLAQI